MLSQTATPIFTLSSRAFAIAAFTIEFASAKLRGNGRPSALAFHACCARMFSVTGFHHDKGYSQAAISFDGVAFATGLCRIPIAMRFQAFISAAAKVS
jgi:hypothetical protein